MRLDPWIAAMPVALTVLALLLTGPGLWSERWGWARLRRGRRREPPRAGR